MDIYDNPRKENFFDADAYTFFILLQKLGSLGYQLEQDGDKWKVVKIRNSVPAVTGRSFRA